MFQRNFTVVFKREDNKCLLSCSLFIKLLVILYIFLDLRIYYCQLKAILLSMRPLIPTHLPNLSRHCLHVILRDYWYQQIVTNQTVLNANSLDSTLYSPHSTCVIQGQQIIFQTSLSALFQTKIYSTIRILEVQFYYLVVRSLVGLR